MRLRRLAALAVVVVLGVARARSRRSTAEPPSGEGRLRYQVPVGQDAAAVLASVRSNGFSAEVELVGGDEDIVITCDRARSRERVRAILAAAPIDMNGHPFRGPAVTFVDEEGPSIAGRVNVQR